MDREWYNVGKDRSEEKFEGCNKKEDETAMLVEDRIFEIPKSKSSEFLKQFETAKITNSFLEECRRSAIKTKKTRKKDR